MFIKHIARLCSGSRYAIIFLESSSWSASTDEACFQPSMRLRILRGTCLGNFSGVHAWNIQTKNQMRALQQPLAQAKQPLPLAQQQFPALQSRTQRNCLVFNQQSNLSRQCTLWRKHITSTATILQSPTMPSKDPTRCILRRRTASGQFGR